MPREPVAPDREDPAEPMPFMICNEDVTTHGPTEQCAGCRGLVRGYRDQHSQACRQRFADLLKGDPKRKRRIGQTEERRVQATVKGAERQWRAQGTDPTTMQQASAEGSGRGGPEPVLPGEDLKTYHDILLRNIIGARRPAAGVPSDGAAPGTDEAIPLPNDSSRSTARCETRKIDGEAVQDEEPEAQRVGAADLEDDEDLAAITYLFRLDHIRGHPDHVVES